MGKFKYNYIVTKIVTSAVEVEVETEIEDTYYARQIAKENAINQGLFVENIEDVEYIVESND